MSFILDLDKIEEDEKFDGYFVYETSRKDLKLEEIFFSLSQTISNWRKPQNIEIITKNLTDIYPNWKTYSRAFFTKFHCINCFILQYLKLMNSIINKVSLKNNQY
ncbi:hypothetical protein ACWXVQ_02700 [Mycoplasma sp. 527]